MAPAAAPEPHGMPADNAELLRQRERLARLTVRLDVLARTVAELEERFDALTESEKIAAAVGAAIHDERRALLNWPRKIAGAVLALLVAVPAAHELVLWFAS